MVGKETLAVEGGCVVVDGGMKVKAEAKFSDLRFGF
jgi:hypothetical protein